MSDRTQTTGLWQDSQQTANLNQNSSPYSYFSNYQPYQVNQQNPTFGTSDQFNIPTLDSSFNYGQQQQQQNDFLKGFSDAINSQQTFGNLQDQYANKYGIPQLAEQVQSYNTLASGLANQLAALPDQVGQNTAGSLVTAGQRGNILASKQQPLQENLQAVGNLGQAAQSNLNLAQQMRTGDIQMEMAQMQKELAPWEKKYDLMNIQQAREFTGWNAESERELSRLQANQQAGLGWTDAEANRANELEKIKQAYSSKLEYDQKYAEGIQNWFTYYQS